MPFEDGMEILTYARSAKTEEQLFERWVVGGQFEMSFDDFKKKIGYTANIEENKKHRKPETIESVLDSVRKIIG